MKEYEIFSDLRVPVNSKIIVRLDGRSFHSFAKKMELVKPYDDAFYNVMVNVSKELFEEFSPLFIYTFSDEISVLLDKVPFKMNNPISARRIPVTNLIVAYVIV